MMASLTGHVTTSTILLDVVGTLTTSFQMGFISELAEFLLLSDISLSTVLFVSGFHAFQTDLALTVWTLYLTLVCCLVSLN